TANNDFGECKLLLRKWQKDLDDNQEDLILETFESIINNFKPEVYRKGLKEDSFVHEVFEPNMLVKELFSGQLMFWKHLYIGNVKVKSAEYMSSNKNKITLEDCDLVKLGNEMKDIIDKCFDDGVEDSNLVICGFLCRVYTMDLKFEAIYRMILLGKFYLPRDSSDLGVLPISIERLMQVKNIMNCSSEICKRKIQILADNEVT
ncbi:6313_t:CDS:2, partial [Scutellospora calospora]